MGLGSSLKKAVKKVASVATSAVAGFAGGGAIGALGSTVKGVIDNTKTSQANTINLREVGQSFATGAVTNVAAGVGAGLVKMLPVISANPGGGGLLSKAVQFGKSGGFVGNFGNILRGAGNFLNKGFSLVNGMGIFNQGQNPVPGSAETTGQISQDFSGVANAVRSGYNRLKPGTKQGLKDIATDIRENGFSGGDTVDKIKEIFIGRESMPSPASAPPVVVTGGGGDGASQQTLMLAGLGLAALFLLKKKG